MPQCISNPWSVGPGIKTCTDQLFMNYCQNVSNAKTFFLADPEWPHRQCAGLAFRRSHVRGSLSAASILLLLKKKVGSARLRESDAHPISLKTPAPQYQPIDRKKRKGKRVEDYSKDRQRLSQFLSYSHSISSPKGHITH